MSLVMNSLGILINPFELKDSDFDPRVIAQTLSRTCRFWGQTSSFYSVAQHCLIMTKIFEGQPELQKWAMLHEVFEGLTGIDLPSPLKNTPQMVAYKEAEERALIQASRLFGLTPPLPDEIKIADARLMVTEALELMDTKNFNWESIAKPYGQDVAALIQQEVETTDVESVRSRFLEQWNSLF